MLYLILAIVCVVLATMIIWSFVDLSINYGFKEVLKAKWTIVILCLGIIVGICAIPLYNKHIRIVQSDAIDHYIVGDVELHEKTIDGDVVDWLYVVTPADYE
jgi:hypothetical protein